MTSANTNYFLQANLTLLSKTDYSTTTIKLINRPKLSDANEAWYPILKDISKIGAVTDRVSVLPNSGTLTLIDSIGSFGVERKFSDLLQRYSIHDQDVSIYYAATNLTDEDPSLTLCFKGKVTEWRLDCSSSPQTIELSFDNRVFPKKYVNKVIQPKGGTQPPTQNLYKNLPLVFGTNIQVPAINLTTATNTTFCYATTLSDQFVNGGIQNFYVKDASSNYVEVKSASNVSTAVIDTTGVVTDQQDITTTFADTERAFFLKDISDGNNYILTQVDLKVAGASGAATYDGVLGIKIYEDSPLLNCPSNVLLATSQVEVSDYDSSFDAGTSFFITFVLDKPAVLSDSKRYWISVRHTKDSGAGAIFIYRNDPLSNSVGFKQWRSSSAYAGGWKNVTGTLLEKMGLKAYAMKLTDVPNPTGLNDYIDQTGLSMSTFGITQRSSVSGYSNPTGANLNFIVNINGILDDSSGNITGVANAQINYFHHAIKLLSYEWNGSTFADQSKWDFSVYSEGLNAATSDSSNPYYRKIAGFTEGLTSFESWLRQACEDLAAKVVVRNDGKLSLYYFGGELSITRNFNQDNSKALAMYSLDTSYVINRAIIAYGRALLTSETYFTLNGRISDRRNPLSVSNYTSVLDLYTGADSDITTLVGGSPSIYGTKQNQQILLQWAQDSVSARTLAKYFLTTFNEAPQYVTIESSFNEFVDTQLLEVGMLILPSLPAYYGTSPNSVSPYYSGDSVDVTLGYTYTRAEGYRVQIEEKYIDFDDNDTPKITFNCRLLTNSKDPT